MNEEDRMYKLTNYLGQEVNLVEKATGRVLVLGDKVRTFRGEERILTQIQPPHKSNSEGKVCLKKDPRDYDQQVYANVIGAEFRTIE